MTKGHTSIRPSSSFTHWSFHSSTPVLCSYGTGRTLASWWVVVAAYGGSKPWLWRSTWWQCPSSFGRTLNIRSLRYTYHIALHLIGILIVQTENDLVRPTYKGSARLWCWRQHYVDENIQGQDTEVPRYIWVLAAPGSSRKKSIVNWILQLEAWERCGRMNVATETAARRGQQCDKKSEAIPRNSTTMYNIATESLEVLV